MASDLVSLGLRNLELAALQDSIHPSCMHQSLSIREHGMITDSHANFTCVSQVILTHLPSAQLQSTQVCTNRKDCATIQEGG